MAQLNADAIIAGAKSGVSDSDPTVRGNLVRLIAALAAIRWQQDRPEIAEQSGGYMARFAIPREADGLK